MYKGLLEKHPIGLIEWGAVTPNEYFTFNKRKLHTLDESTDPL